MSVTELNGLIQSAGKLVRDLYDKVQVYDKERKECEVLLGKLAETDKKQAEKETELVSREAAVATIENVVAERIKNEQLAKENDAKYASKMEKLSAWEKTLSEERKSLNKDREDLVLEREQLTKEQRQLVDEKKTYKAEIIKKLQDKL